MKTLITLTIFLASCTAQRYIPDVAHQVTLITAFKEDKANACGLPLNKEVFGRTWHIELLKKNGDTVHHHYFTVSQVKQSWLRPGDQYTYSYDSRDSVLCETRPFIYAKLKWNK